MAEIPSITDMANVMCIIHTIYSTCRTGAVIVDRKYISGRKGRKNEKTYYYSNDYIKYSFYIRM